MEITVAKALKVKNVLKRELKEKKERFRKKNAIDIPEGDSGSIRTRSQAFGTPESAERAEHECSTLLEDIRKLMMEISKLKGKIDAAQNENIRKQVYELAERKALLSFLQKENFTSKHPKKVDGIRSNFFLSVIDEEDIQVQMKEEKKAIQKIQDDLDLFNQQTYLQLDEKEFSRTAEFV